MSKPNLSFLCELDSDALQSLFADETLYGHLATLGATIVLGTVDLSSERADVVRELNERGIPVMAWQLLSEDGGYWYAMGNASAAVNRYNAFKDWTAAHGLSWAGMVLDFEPEYRQLGLIRASGLLRMGSAMLTRLGNSRKLRHALSVYQALVAEMRRDGYQVASYQMRLMADERRAGSTLVQRLFGVVDVPVDRRGLVLYSSSHRAQGPALIWSYGRDAQIILLGSTAESAVASDPAPLAWEELARDLRIAHDWSEEIAIYSLEGCVGRGYLPRLLSFDWDEAPPARPENLKDVILKRHLLEGSLWASRYLGWMIAAGLIGLLGLGRWLLAGDREGEA